MKDLDVASKTSVSGYLDRITPESETNGSETVTGSLPFGATGERSLFLQEPISSSSTTAATPATTEAPFYYRRERTVTPQIEEVLRGLVDRLEGDYGYILIDDGKKPRQLKMHIAVLTRDSADYEGAPVRIVTQIINGEVITRVEHDKEVPANWIEEWDREWEEKHGEPYTPKRPGDFEKVRPIDPRRM